MRLISCYIENFGGLSDYSIEFEKNITVIKKPNGFGKTTLAAFICIMLYGMPESRKKNLKDKERWLYMPWNGGSYGGNLVFETKSKKYRIERSFGSAPAQDSFRLYDLDTNTLSDDFPDCVGLKLFGLDLESFKRSIFMPQLFNETNMNTGKIINKLGNLAEDTGDVSNYNKAREVLEEKRREYKHKTGDGGSINKTKGKIAAVRQRLEGRAGLEAKLSYEKNDYKNLLENIEENKKKRDDILRRIDAGTKNILTNELKRLDNNKNKLLSMQTKLETKYPKGLPSYEDTYKRRDTARRLDGLIYSIYQDNYSEDTPIVFSDGNDTLEKLEEMFSTGVPTDEELNKISRLVEKADELRAENEEILLSADGNSTLRKKANIPLLSFIAGVLLLSGGIALIFIEQPIAGAIFLLIALGAFTAAFVLNSRQKRSTEFNEKTKRRLMENKEKINQLESSVREFACRYIPDNNDTDKLLSTLRSKIESYISMSNKRKKYNELYREISDFSNTYGIQKSYPYTEFIDTVIEDIQSEINIKDDIIKNNTDIAEFNKKHPDISVEDVFEDTEDINALRKNEKAINSEIDKMLEERPEKEGLITELTEKIEALAHDEDTLIALNEKLNNDEKNYELLVNTIDLLEKANDSLSNTCSNILHDGFMKYAHELFSKEPANVFIDKKLNISIDESGKLREIAYYSAGYTDIIMLSMRLALIDAMFKEEEPFIILDDSFVNLDDEHIKKVLGVLKHIAEKKQIIYMVCSAGRC